MNTILKDDHPRTRQRIQTLQRIATWALAASLVVAVVGCDQPPPIRQYSISTEVPAALRSQDRMLGAMIPQATEVWFFKLVGPTEAVEFAAAELRQFIGQVEFVDGQPDLSSLPKDWNRGGERQMRFATVMIPTPSKELELSISSLPKTGQWDEQVAMNVNRWRDQMQLAESEDRWAGAQPLRSDDATEQPAVWVDLVGEMGDLVGEMGAGPSAMVAAPFASGGELPPGHPEISASGPGSAGGPGRPSSQREASDAEPAAADAPMAATAAGSAENPAGLKYDAPADWRAGKMSMMRMAAFEIGPEDRSAELTIIQAGGDLRGNVDRWLGQVRGDSPPGEVVDAALQDAEQLRVSGRDAQRFYLTDGKESAPDAEAIDATIVPLESGMSLFIKATGPAETLSQQREAIGQFLESLSLPQ